MNRNAWRATSLSLCAALTLTGCQTMPSIPGMAGTSSGTGTGGGACVPLGGSDAQNAAIGGVGVAALGAVLGASMARKKEVGARNGALLGALMGAMAGSQYNSMIDVTQMPDGSVKLLMPGAIVFSSGSARISPTFASTLRSVSQSIQKYCDVTATVVGHTDNVGSDALNDRLSLDRATAVVNELAREGIPMSRLRADRRGSREPLNSNATESDRAQNRRVEVFVRPPSV